MIGREGGGSKQNMKINISGMQNRELYVYMQKSLSSTHGVDLKIKLKPLLSSMQQCILDTILF